MTKLSIMACAVAAALAVPAVAAPAPAAAATLRAEPAAYYGGQHFNRHRPRWRTVCRRVWRHHRPVRVCRRVRVRR